MTPPSPLARKAALALGLVALVGLFLQLALLIEDFAAQGQGPLAAVWRFLGFFTILTNIWVAAVMLLVAFGRPIGAQWQTAVMLAIVLVGVVYHLLLAGLHSPVGLDFVANHIVHTIVPLATMAWWFAFTDRDILAWSDVKIFLVWPMAYTGYALLRGAADGWYPYFFMDVSSLGLPRVLLNIAAMGAVFAIVGLGFVALGRSGRRGASA